MHIRHMGNPDRNTNETETMKAKGHRGIDLTESEALYDRAIAVIAGGVTSARRRTSALDHPIYFERGAGAYLWDVDPLISL